MTLVSSHAAEKEVSILAGILGKGQGQLTEEIAVYILELGFTDAEKARMHDLAVRYQKDSLSPEEKDELLAFGKAGDTLAILKSKARRTLGVQRKPRSIS